MEIQTIAVLMLSVLIVAQFIALFVVYFVLSTQLRTWKAAYKNLWARMEKGQSITEAMTEHLDRDRPEELC